MNSVQVKTQPGYEVIIGKGVIKTIPERINGGSVCIITDDNVKGLYGDALQKSLLASGIRAVMYSLKPGERSKSFEEYGKILEFLSENHITRSDIIIALGGGVVGDIAGFSAATYLRGIRFIQVPTTLLAAIDSSVGGKTGINLPAGKNLAGAFYQPDMVICDIETLETLGEEAFKDGIAEAIKYGIIEGRELFEIVAGGNIGERLEDIIMHCVHIKSDLVSIDEKDIGARQLLNFGHTIGHAIEKLSDFSVSHGCAVSIGMAMISAAAQGQGLCRCHDRIRDALLQNGLPVSTGMEKDKLIEVVLSDKKRKGDRITLVLPLDIGNCILHNIPVNELPQFI